MFLPPLSLEEYLSHRYSRPTGLGRLPLPDEGFVARWQQGRGLPLPVLLQELGLPWDSFAWHRPEAMELSFAATLAGRLPVVSLQDHGDFCAMVSLLYGKEAPQNYPPAVNACAVNARYSAIAGQRVLVLNRSPYSNISAAELGLEEAEWLDKSQQLRLRHESAHYECLRLLGGMRNHLRDEIVADALGQLAAFGSFSAQRQRLFFGLSQEADTCNGRLVKYCQRLREADRSRLYRHTNKLLEELEPRLARWQQEGLSQLELLLRLACDI